MQDVRFVLAVLLIAGGLGMTVAGIVFLSGAWPRWLGRLPGDIACRGKHVTVYVPLVTALLLSLVFTLLVNGLLLLLRRLR